MMQSVCVKTRGPSHNTVDFIALFEQQLRPGDPSAKVHSCSIDISLIEYIRHTTGHGEYAYKTIGMTATNEMSTHK